MSKKEFSGLGALLDNYDTNKSSPEQKKEVEKIIPKTTNVYLQQRTEKKTKRVQLLLKPSNYDKLKKLSKQNKTSLNDLVNLIIENL